MATASSSISTETPANDNDVIHSIQPEADGPTFMDSRLYWAAAKGKIDAFEEDRVLSLDQILTPNKNSVLHVYITSSATGKTKFVDEILGMCPALLLQPNANGDISLHVAARYGHVHIVDLLIELAGLQDHLGDHDLETGGNSTIVGVTKEMLRKRNKEKDTPLHEAVRFGHLGVVRILTEQDPDYLYAANETGETPLYMAAERGYGDLVVEILANCSLVAAGGPNNRTALHAATIAKDEDMTRILLQKKIYLTKEADDKGWVPLHYAADLNYLSIVKMLLDYDKYAAYIKDKEGKTSLHIAASHGHRMIMKQIMQLCPDCCELVDNKGWNVLHYAVENDYVLAVNEIVRTSAFKYLLNGKDNKGNTPFHFAPGSVMAKKLLSRPGLDKSAFNKQNQNALDMALARMKQVMLLSSYRNLFLKVGLRPRLRLIPSPIEDHDESDQENENKDLSISKKEKARDASLILATLIATVTFTACFALPGGYVSDKGPLQGTAVMRKNGAFQVFVTTNMIAFVLSSIAVLCLLSIVLMSKTNKYKSAVYFDRATQHMLWATGAMVVALSAAMFAVLEPSLPLAIVVCIFGLYFFNHFIPEVHRYTALRHFKFKHNQRQSY